MKKINSALLCCNRTRAEVDKLNNLTVSNGS
jgi:hypothetical protein